MIVDINPLKRTIMCHICGIPLPYEYCCGEVTPRADDDYNDEYDDYDDYKGRIER